jgi:hypothetical protein
MPGPGHDQVVVELDAELEAGVAHFLGHLDVGLRRRRVAGRVVVHHEWFLQLIENA